jgi:hypothetical protein
MAHRHLAPFVVSVACLIAGCGSVARDGDPAGGTSTTDRSTAPTALATTSTSRAPEEPSDLCTGLERLPGALVVSDPPLAEISGAVLSTRSPEAVWVHEDSGNEPVLTELGLDGTTRSRWVVPDARNVDWEDVAAAEDDEGVRHLFIGDVGDNRRVRPHVEILRLPEPLGKPTGPTAAPATLRLLLPDGPADIEALLVEPVSADLVLVTKELTGAAQVLVASGAAWSPDGTTLEVESRGVLRLGPGQAVLAADLHPSGTQVALRTPSRVLLWAHEPGAPLTATLLDGQPCRAPAVFDIVGEALAFLDEGYVLVGEGGSPSLVIVR